MPDYSTMFYSGRSLFQDNKDDFSIFDLYKILSNNKFTRKQREAVKIKIESRLHCIKI